MPCSCSSQSNCTWVLILAFLFIWFFCGNRGGCGGGGCGSCGSTGSSCGCGC